MIINAAEEEEETNRTQKERAEKTFLEERLEKLRKLNQPKIKMQKNTITRYLDGHKDPQKAYREVRLYLTKNPSPSGLTIALSFGDLDLVKGMASGALFNPNRLDYEGDTPLIAVIKSFITNQEYEDKSGNYLKIAKLLTGKSYPEVINQKDNDGFSALGIVKLFDTIYSILSAEIKELFMTEKQFKELTNIIKFLERSGARLDHEELNLIQNHLQKRINTFFRRGLKRPLT